LLLEIFTDTGIGTQILCKNSIWIFQRKKCLSRKS
jgi:hypothetical protein